MALCCSQATFSHLKVRKVMLIFVLGVEKVTDSP